MKRKLIVLFFMVSSSFFANGQLVESAPITYKDFRTRVTNHINDPEHNPISVIDTFSFIDSLIQEYKYDNLPTSFRPVFIKLLRDTTFYPKYNVKYDTGMPMIVISRSVNNLKTMNFVILFYIDNILIDNKTRKYSDINDIYIKKGNANYDGYNDLWEQKKIYKQYDFYKKWLKKNKKYSLEQIRAKNLFPINEFGAKWIINSTLK